MADFNDAIRQFLMQMQQQGSTGPGGVAGADLPSGPASYGSTGPASANLSLAQAGRTPNDGTPSGISLLQPQVNTATPPSGGSMPSDMRQMNQTIPHMQPQQQPFAPPSQAQDQGMAGAAGAQMPPGILQAMIQKLLGMQPQGQNVTTQGGLGQIAPDWRPAQ